MIQDKQTVDNRDRRIDGNREKKIDNTDRWIHEKLDT